MTYIIKNSDGKAIAAFNSYRDALEYVANLADRSIIAQITNKDGDIVS